MKLSTTILTGAVYVSVLVAQTAATCQGQLGGNCGYSSRPRDQNCCVNGYCQPWNSGYYQCIAKPQLCPKQETDIDYYGNDLKTIYGIFPNDCCNECSKTSGCRAYTFVNENPDGKSACYLKSATSGRVEKKGAVSGELSVCANEVGAPCGNAQSGPACCVDSAFCQPWNAGYYQCIAKPPNAKCPTVVVGIDFYGLDIETKYGLLPDSCCDACYAHPQCHTFTFVNENPDGRSACYLKTGIAEQRPKASAISGYKIKM
uniref:Apple domain-containing protein n=1 Tax=Globisporangium ultimum (strain ATCC 200006 / CBS 805.95 / DAOM BR144) TaxID=431595 RepID=K3WD79_GLOUD